MACVINEAALLLGQVSTPEPQRRTRHAVACKRRAYTWQLRMQMASTSRRSA